MKKIISVTILSLFLQFAYCQNNYFKVLSSPLNEGANASIETENGNIIIQTGVTSGNMPPKTEYSQFLLLNPNGDVIGSRKFKLSEDIFYFRKILKLDNGEYCAVGCSYNYAPYWFYSIYNKVIYFTFNSNLDSISYNEIVMEDNPIQWFCIREAIINNNNNIVTLCEDMSYLNIMLLEATLTGDSIRSSRLVPTKGATTFSIMQKSNSSGYLITADGDYNHLNHGYVSHVITIDTNLNFTAIDSLPGECAYFSQLSKFNNDILVGGRAHRSWGGYPPPIPPPDPYHTQEYCIEKLDTNFHVTKQLYLSHVYLNHNYYGDDTISYPAMNQNFDFINTNNIFTCHYREFPASAFPNGHNYFVIAKLNSNLDVTWQYYFGYDAFYRPFHIIATSDGGCFINGSRYDSETQFQELDVFYLKLDSTGVYVSTHDPIIPVHSAIVYPSPGTDRFTLESGVQVFGATFLLYDMLGIKITEEIISSNQQSINTEALESGTYIWKIVKAGKVLDSGKWIKIK